MVGRVIMLAVESLFWAGLGAGLASVAGLRAFVVLALFGLFARLGFVVPPGILGLKSGWTFVLVLSVLAVVEIVLDKVRALDPAFGYVMVPIRTMAGAALFATVYEPAAAAPGLVAGGGIAALVAVLGVILRPSPTGSSAGVSTAFLSAVEDAVAVLGGIVGLFVPFLPLLFVGFLLFFFYRIRRRRGRKYGGLRILGD
ncbi:MAG: DUF4126 domain-containing protein [Actinomycetota bacterium]|nr:DUF4126 domain-containing protein [Actinomycetota bacterium]